MSRPYFIEKMLFSQKKNFKASWKKYKLDIGQKEWEIDQHWTAFIGNALSEDSLSAIQKRYLSDIAITGQSAPFFCSNMHKSWCPDPLGKQQWSQNSRTMLQMLLRDKKHKSNKPLSTLCVCVCPRSMTGLPELMYHLTYIVQSRYTGAVLNG